MRKITLFDGSIVEGDVGYDPATKKFIFRPDVKQVEFEDGTILINPDFNLENVLAKKNSEIEAKRKLRYQNESDPMFFAYQRGSVTNQEWINAVNLIKSELPYVS